MGRKNLKEKGKAKTKTKMNRESFFYRERAKKPKKEDINKSPMEDAFFKRACEIGLILHRQYPVSKYKVDFVYIHKDEQGNEKFKIAIEIDGKKYHTRLEQLNNDYKRERFLLLNGFRVVRFTGSEVFNECFKCVNEVINIINYLNGSLVFAPKRYSSNPIIKKLNEESLTIVVRENNLEF